MCNPFAMFEDFGEEYVNDHIWLQLNSELVMLLSRYPSLGDILNSGWHIGFTLFEKYVQLIRNDSCG